MRHDLGAKLFLVQIVLFQKSGPELLRWNGNVRPAFRRVRAQRLLLEYDDARSGSFEPLKEVPEDKWVVLGLITTKRPHLESIDELESRIREASRFMPLEHLAISPHAAFPAQ